jgi:chemotaxis protein MotB
MQPKAKEGVMRRVIAVAVAALVCGCLVPKEQLDQALKDAEAASQKTRSAEEKVAALEEKNKQLQAESDQLKQQNGDLQTALTNKEAERRDLEGKNAQLAALNDELSKSTKKLAEAKADLEKKSAEYESLADSLKNEIQAGKVELSEMKGRMTVKMKDKILFASGSASLGKEGQAALDKVAKALKEVKGKIIRVEGHTDNDATDPKGPFKDNWQLSLARAMAVVSHLQDQGVDPTKLSAAGYGQYQPIAANDTAAHKSLNRRIEIVLANSEGIGSPAAAATAATPAAPAKAEPAKAEPKGTGGKSKTAKNE